MHFLIVFLGLLYLTFLPCGRTSSLEYSTHSTDVMAEDNPHNSGTTEVEWDSTSLIIQGRRVFVWSAEFHFWRLPVPDLWRDVLQKLKAAGFNTVSCYIHWGATNPTEGRVEWEGYRDFELFLQIAQQVGLWVIARPGPYINGETSAGGIPGRVTNIAGFLRSNDTDYYNSWQEYLRSAAKIIQRYQINEGGPIILVQAENEYTNNTNFATPNPVTKNEYMQAVEDLLRAVGIVLPLTSNDSYEGRNFAPGSGVGAVDIYGLDSYPQGSCATPFTWSTFPVDYWNYHESVNPQNPWMIPEFQGGSFLGWGPGSPDYKDCNVLTGVEFEQTYYLNQFATGVKLNNVYMTYGGTSWGFFPFPGVYTSYDYGAAIAEDRTLTGKWFELKNIAMLLRSIESDIANSRIIGNSSADYTGDPEVFVTELRNPDNGAAIYIVRHVETNSLNKTESKVNITTSLGTITIPQTEDVSITLDGRQSRLFVVDHAVGQSAVLYSTASLFYSGVIGTRDVFVFHGPAGQSFEIAIKTPGMNRTFSGDFTVHAATTIGNYTLLTFTPDVNQMSISVTSSALIILGDSSSMTILHSPILPASDGSVFFGTTTNETILVKGPLLVRNATVSKDTLDIWGDLNFTTTVTTYAPDSVKHLTWNGRSVNVRTLSPGILAFTQEVTMPELVLPKLSDWKYADSLPEIQDGYNDSRWTDANHLNSTNPFFKYYGDYYLYACEYGFCEGPVLWRGHFNSSGSETAVNLSISGGRAFAGSVWLNDVFLGSTYGNSSNNDNSIIVQTTNETYEFPDGALHHGSNVITVLHDNMGMDEANANQYTEWLKSPRGVQGYYLIGGSTQPLWKVQGKLGGFSEFPDRYRGIMNEGGFFGERQGWHLPGFDDKDWTSKSLSEGLDRAGVGFFRTTFNLNVPSGYDVILSFNFPPYGSGTYRAFLYVNGWNMGRYVANLGPQSRFIVHQGILDYTGANTVAIALWATSKGGASVQSLELKVDSIFAGGVGTPSLNNPGWKKRDAF